MDKTLVFIRRVILLPVVCGLCATLLAGCPREDGSDILISSKPDGMLGESSADANGRAEGSYELPLVDVPSHVPEEYSEPPVWDSQAEEESYLEQDPSNPETGAESVQAASEAQSSTGDAGVALRERREDLFALPDADTSPGGESQHYVAEDRGGKIDPADFEQELLRLINGERTAQGIEPLGLEDNMRWAARIRAPEVLQSLSHTRPDGTAYYTAFDEAGFVYAGKWHGENVSSMQFSQGLYDSKSAAAYMFDQLKSSSGHYNNMLNSNFSQIGIGVFVRQDGKNIRIGSAQMFASF